MFIVVLLYCYIVILFYCLLIGYIVCVYVVWSEKKAWGTSQCFLSSSWNPSSPFPLHRGLGELSYRCLREFWRCWNMFRYFQRCFGRCSKSLHIDTLAICQFAIEKLSTVGSCHSRCQRLCSHRSTPRCGCQSCLCMLGLNSQYARVLRLAWCCDGHGVGWWVGGLVGWWVGGWWVVGRRMYCIYSCSLNLFTNVMLCQMFSVGFSFF